MFRRLVGFLLAVSVLATACGSTTTYTAETSTFIETDSGLAETEVADSASAPTAVPTTRPLLPDGLVQPGFAGAVRPDDAIAVNVLHARSDVRVVSTFNRPDGDPIDMKYEFLDGRVIDWPLVSPTLLGNNLVLTVATGSPGDAWAEVHISTRPATTAWVRTEDFRWEVSNYYVRVDVPNNEIIVWNGDEVVLASSEVSAGAPESATPLATAYVDGILDGYSDFLGPKIISLSLFSESLSTFQGGIPKIALHGTDAPDLLGQHASNGCIRLDNDMIETLAGFLPVGTRVDLVGGP